MNTSDVTHNIKKEFRYIIVGNIIDKHLVGQEKALVRGTKQFRPGAKVFILPRFGRSGYENLPVYGLPRKSWKKITIVIKSVMIKNARVKKTFDPKMIEMINNNSFYEYYGDDKAELERFAQSINSKNVEIETEFTDNL